MPRDTIFTAATKAVIFDAYGTLFDVHSAVMRHAPEAQRLSAIWRAKQLEYTWVLSLASRYEPFWTLTERALDHAFALCPEVDVALRDQFLEAYRTLDAYPDVPAALGDLRERGLVTGVLSNGDLSMLRDAARAAKLDGLVAPLISVESAKVYKTSPRAYALVLEAVAAAARNIVFVSSNRWDVAGAAAFGFTAVWVNRGGGPAEYPGLDPIATVASLSEVAAGV